MKFITIASIVCLSATLFAQSFPVEYKVVFTDAVYFDFGKHDLRPEADAVLSEATKLLNTSSNYFISITAHTDSIGSLKNNLALSARRSNSLKEALIAKGTDDGKIQIDNFGETTPDSTNATETGRQANRRATVKILLPPPMTLLTGQVIEVGPEKETGLYSMVVLRTKNWQDTLFTDSLGYFEKELPIGIVIGIDAYADCHFFNSTMTKTTSKKELVKIGLEPVEAGKSLNLNNLYFVGNQAVLLPKSEPEMPKILNFMLANPNMVIEVAGHINRPNEPKVDVETSHYLLSVNRAKLVHDYLISNGIPDERISYAGYGNWEMKYPHAISEKQQALNRRVELKVLEGGCND